MQRISTEREQNKTWLGGKGDPLGIVQEVKIWPFKQMVYAQPSICPGEWDAQTPLGFWDLNRSPNLDPTTRPYNNHQKKRTCRIVDFAVLADHRVKLKESEKKDKYLDFAWELIKLWYVKMTEISIVIGTLSIGTKGLV